MARRSPPGRRFCSRTTAWPVTSFQSGSVSSLRCFESWVSLIDSADSCDVPSNDRLRGAVSPPRNPIRSDTGTRPNLQYSDASNRRFATRGGRPPSARKRRLPDCVGHTHLSTIGPQQPTRCDIILATTRRYMLPALVLCVGASQSDTPTRFQDPANQCVFQQLAACETRR